VFEKLHVPILLGNDILNDDGEIGWYRPPLLGSSTAWRLNIHSAQRNVTILALIDTWASCNVISMAESMKLGYWPDQNKVAEFCLANGRVFKSKGQITLSFQLASGGALQSADFQVFENTPLPIIVGAELGFQMGMFHLAPYHWEDSSHLVTRLSRKGHRSTRHFRGFVNNEIFRTSADTGSDLNLISPSAVSRLSGTISIETENLDITLGGGSKDRIITSLQASFFPYSAPEESFTERFYILEGMIDDVILGRQLLDKIGAFTRNQASFSHSIETSIFYNLNVVALLSMPSVKLLSMFRADRRRARRKSDVSSAKPTLRTLPPSSTADADFYTALKAVAAYETHLRDKAGLEITSLSGVQKTVAQDAEKRRIERYEADLKRRLDERKQDAIRTS